MFTEGENIIKYYFKTLRGCDTAHNSNVNSFVGCFLAGTTSCVPEGLAGGVVWGAGGPHLLRGSGMGCA